ncbi:MAG: DUF309 domain-containing protein [Metallosphaera yellowstonensis]|jgi:hypothetical protein|uniref:DUF309 domain-containing protein n=1 Tax=Metallosphaera yellowstonensis MK1 TaxID=671065 RepID=H2C974_9CREN|nr:DUF309 domain-containing protein [Metallosphaera yellowstonensis]EHP68700.1 hypothetical protein MetMK1DRAFT_00031450 [Metallosphaera yellowstonensis MK1]
MTRFLLFYPLDKQVTLQSSVGFKIVEVRECLYKEVDVIGDLEEAKKSLGDPLFVIEVGKTKESLWDLLNQCRFWEAHELLEEVWRRSQGYEKKYLQALILLMASMIKFRKSWRVSDEILERALSLISELPEDLLPLLYVRLGLNT